MAKVLDLSGIVGTLTSIFLNLLFKISFSGDPIMASIILVAIFLATLLFFYQPLLQKVNYILEILKCHMLLSPTFGFQMIQFASPGIRQVMFRASSREELNWPCYSTLHTLK